MSNTAIAIQASPSGFAAGSWIFGSVMLGLGNNPTGTITFTLYGPSDITCTAAPLTVSQVAVAGNNYYASPSYQTDAAGTYRWTARYNGDHANKPTPTTACSDPGGAVIMAKRVVSLRSTASFLEGLLSNAATLTNGVGPTGPAGTMTFTLFAAGNMTCGGLPILTTVRPVSGNGTYVSDLFPNLLPGVYQWIVRYSGDANNHPAATSCSDPANAGTVTAPVAGATVTATPTTLRAYEPLTVNWNNIATPTTGDWFALYALGAPDGTVVVWRYTGGSATGSATVTVPWGTKPGSYEVRLFANNSATRIDVSEVITVVA